MRLRDAKIWRVFWRRLGDARTWLAYGLGRVLSTREGLAATICAAAIAVVVGTPLGAYLDEHVFQAPLERARARLGAQPELAPEVRVVLADDQALNKLGRQVRFDEWARIAHLLRQLGFERILLHEPQNLAAEVGDLSALDPADALAVGTIDTLGQKSSRAVATEALPPGLLAPDAPALAALPVASQAIALHASAWRHVLGFGHVNVYNRDEFPAAFRTPGGGVLPELAFYGLGGPAAAGARVAALGDSVFGASRLRLGVEYIAFRSILDRAVSVRGFLDGGEVRDDLAALPESVRHKLEGGKVAVLVPAAYTGSRSWESPVEGTLPGYVQFLSIVTGVLRDRLPFRPFAPWLVLVVAAPLVIAALRERRFAVAARNALVLFLVVTALGAAGFQRLGWILPVAEVWAVLACAGFGRAAQHLFGVTKEKLALGAQLELGSAVQTLLIAQERAGVVGDWEYAITFRPHGAMSGDWVQVFAKDDVPGLGAVLVLAIGDVVGKGASAALVTSSVAAVWSRCARDWGEGRVDADALIQELNTLIFETYRGQQNSTLSLVVVTGDQLRFYAYAAPRWLRLNPDGSSGLIRHAGHNPLGLMAEIKGNALAESGIAPGVVFLAYTDGVIDGALARGNFLKRAQPIMRGPAAAAFGALEALAIEVGAASVMADDVTMVFLRRRPAAAALAG